MKKRVLAPRRKKMTWQRRLQSAKATGWVTNYSGKNIVKGYSKWFGVDLLCALFELRVLGVSIDAAREHQIRATISARGEATKRRREAAAASNPSQFKKNEYPDHDIFWELSTFDPPEPPDGCDDDFLDELPF